MQNLKRSAVRRSASFVSCHSQRGMALPELAVGVAVLIALACMLLVMGERGRAQAMLSDDLGKLRAIAGLTTQYAADNTDRFWSFSWKQGITPSTYPDLKNAATDQVAAAYQAVDILRRKAGRTDIAAITNWLPHPMANNLVLQDYAGDAFPSRLHISSGDAIRLLWASDPLGFDSGKFLPNQPIPTNDAKRTPYTSSFTSPFALWSFPWSGPNAITHAAVHNLYNIPGGVQLGHRKLTEVAYPSQKVMLHDLIGRHHGSRPAYFAYEEARVPSLMADGNVRVLTTRDTNLGWNPAQPASPTPMLFTYQPQTWEPAKLSDVPNSLAGHYRTTRQGLLGRDTDGPEVP